MSSAGLGQVGQLPMNQTTILIQGEKASLALTSLHTSFPHNQEVANLRLNVWAIHILELEVNTVSFSAYLCLQLPSILCSGIAFPFVIMTYLSL